MEFGTTQDIIAVGAVEHQTPSEESARLIVRYNSDIARGKKVIDDLNREWDVKSSRAIHERRYLQFELSRVVAS